MVFFAETCGRVYIHGWLVIVYNLCAYVGVHKWLQSQYMEWIILYQLVQLEYVGETWHSHGYKMGAAFFSEMSVNLYKTTWCHISEDSILQRISDVPVAVDINIVDFWLWHRIFWYVGADCFRRAYCLFLQPLCTEDADSVFSETLVLTNQSRRAY